MRKKKIGTFQGFPILRNQAVQAVKTVRIRLKPKMDSARILQAMLIIIYANKYIADRRQVDLYLCKEGRLQQNNSNELIQLWE